MDGWGTLVTPYKTYNVLRVKTTLAGYDSVEFSGQVFAGNRPPQVIYKWLAKGEIVPVLEISTAEFMGQWEVTNTEYRDTLQNVPLVGVEEELEEIAVGMYPNPTQQILNLSLPENLQRDAVMEIFDLKGTKVKELSLSAATALLDVSDLPAAVYVVRITASGQLFEGKLTIVRE